MRILTPCFAALAVAAIFAPGASARPFIFYRGILNGASFSPQGIPGGAIARGSIFSIFGRDLGPAQPASVTSFPLGETLGGASIEVCQQQNCVAAIPLFVLQGQINAIMPSGAPLGRVAVRVRYAGEDGNWSPVTVAGASVGLFAVNSAGSGPGITQNFVSATDQPINSRMAPATPGQVVTLWGTGLGAALNPDNQPPQPGDLPANTEVFVGGQPVTNLLYAGRSPCCSGVDQLVFEIPANAPAGCYVPIHVRTNGETVSNSVTMAISPGAPCSDAHNSLAAALAAGQRVGAVSAQKLDIALDVDPEPAADNVTEYAFGFFAQPSPSPFYYNALLLPPPGACSTYRLRAEIFRGRRAAPPNDPPLDAGDALTFRIGGHEFTVGRGAGPQTYAEVLSSAQPTEGESVIGVGTAISVSAAGGADVAALEAEIEPRAPLTWTNRDSFRSVSRGAPLTLQWSPGAADELALVWGESYSPTHDATGRFVCVAEASAGQFTIPAYITAAMPAASRRAWAYDAWIALGLLPPAAAASASTGLDAAAAIFASWQVKTVEVTP